MQSQDTDFTLKNFIVLEGIDGSGTSTQMRHIEAALGKKGLQHMMTAEPTGRPEGLLIRNILQGELDADPGTVAYLFASDRHQHLHGKGGIIEALEAGKLVICDRYAFSSLAYQGITCGRELPEYLNARFPAPGLTVFFRIDPERSLQRLNSRNKLEIYEKIHMQKLVSLAYESIIAEKGSKGWNIQSIDAENPIEQVRRELFSIIGDYTGITLD
ncbi:MAG: dTMP kinase [Spirochaetia bacterium]|jgi:dTMP kinase|nr:dTMP kinase [Spirochaetales bacterium]MDX9783678.1 dTMP kinase [Spirochaetia bacterium]